MSLTLLLILPALFAVACGFAPAKQSRIVALVGSAITFLLSVIGLVNFNGSASNQTYQMVELRPWFPALNISFHFGADGPGLLMVVLTAFLTVASVWYSMDKIDHREKEYYALILALEATVIGAFSSLDLILFYIFFEACLVPAYFLIGIWGGAKRVQAATKFFVYTVVGSLLMLLSIIALYVQTGTFNVLEISEKLAAQPLTPEMSLLIFLGFAAAFAVKTGLVPFHTWLPDAYAEAPVPVTVLMSGAMAKLGTFGFYRFGILLIPEGANQAAVLMITLGTVSILFGGLVAAMQRDVRRVLAYSSISHLGFVVIGLFAGNKPGLSGATLQMVNHGITSAMLFFVAGMIYSRTGSTHLRALGGLWEQTPVLGRFFLIGTLSSVGLPLTNSFVGEFQILLGVAQDNPILGGIATTGVIWSAVYMLVMFQKAMYGVPVRPAVRAMGDLKTNELALLGIFTALVFLIGIQPGFLQRKIDANIDSTVTKWAAADEFIHSPLLRLQRKGETSFRPMVKPEAAPATPSTPSPAPAPTGTPAPRRGGPSMPGA